MDNASSHRNEKIKTLVNKDNSVLKSKLKKLDNLSYKQIGDNINETVKEIPIKNYENIMKGSYNIEYGSKEMKKKTHKKKPKKIYKK